MEPNNLRLLYLISSMNRSQFIVCMLLSVQSFSCLAAAADSSSDTNLIWNTKLESTNVVTGTTNAYFGFDFTNYSKNDVTILGAFPSCGCTTAHLPPVPWRIRPGASGHIGVQVKIYIASGTLIKSILVDTDKGWETLAVRIDVKPSSIEKNPDAAHPNGDKSPP